MLGQTSISLTTSICSQANSRSGIRSRGNLEKEMRTEVEQAVVYAVGPFSNVWRHFKVIINRTSFSDRKIL